METDAKLSFELLLINRDDNAATQRHFLKLLEHEVALAVVVVEELAVFGQPSASVILAVVLLARSASISGFPLLPYHVSFSICHIDASYDKF